MLATTIEQSQYLLDLGLSSETADMCLTWVNNQWNEVADNADKIRKIQICNACDDNGYKPEDVNVVPAWSLGALFDLMPTIHKFEEDYLPNLSSCTYRKNNKKYCCSYQAEMSNGSVVELKPFIADNPLEACFNMVVWLLENGYIKNEK